VICFVYSDLLKILCLEALLVSVSLYGSLHNLQNDMIISLFEIFFSSCLNFFFFLTFTFTFVNFFAGEAKYIFYMGLINHSSLNHHTFLKVEYPLDRLFLLFLIIQFYIIF